MTNALELWTDRAWSELVLIPGPGEVVAEHRSRWERFKALDVTEVVVFGSYDAGKSSLLKRLLVDWGSAVPDWLTISGRRETFEAKRVTVDGLGFVDTPGLGSGDSRHDTLTLSAMELADAYLWVLPPQLVTAGKEDLLELLFGKRGIAEATLAVVARMDEAGIDPADNEAGFSELRGRKESELLSLLQSAKSPRQVRSVHCVVADPYQMVGSTPNPARELYDLGRSWDGVGELGQSIRALRDQRDVLRRAAGARFVRIVIEVVRNELQRLADDLSEGKEGLDNQIHHHALYEQKIDAMQRQARAELHRRIEDTLLSASRSGRTGPETIHALHDALSDLVDDWAEGSFAEVRRLADELELEVRERATGPSMDGFHRLADELAARETEMDQPRTDLVTIGRKAMDLLPAVREAFERYAAMELGMSLKEAAGRLEGLESSTGTVETFINSTKRTMVFRGAQRAERASHFVKWARVLDAVVPFVEQLGGLLLEVANETMTSKQADERAQARREIRAQLRQEAEKLEASAAANFDTTCDGLRRWLSERLSTLESGRRSLGAQLHTLGEWEASLNALLRSCPLERT